MVSHLGFHIRRTATIETYSYVMVVFHISASPSGAECIVSHLAGAPSALGLPEVLPAVPEVPPELLKPSLTADGGRNELFEPWLACGTDSRVVLAPSDPPAAAPGEASGLRELEVAAVASAVEFGAPDG